MKKILISLGILGLLLFPSTGFAIDYPETIPSVVMLEVVDADDSYHWGTGFFISSDAFILTNSHVVMDETTGMPADYIDICVIDDEYSAPECIYSGSVLAYDEYYDLAIVVPMYEIDEYGNEYGDLIDLDTIGNPYVDFADYLPEIGDDLTILGFPDASMMSSITLTEGSVSGFTSYEGEIVDEITTDATINPGNSGGPAYDIYERVVGVVTAISTEGIGGNYGYIISNELIYNWFLELIEDEILNEEFVNMIFFNDIYVDTTSDLLTNNVEIFSDVHYGDKHSIAIGYLKENGIVSGYPDGSYKPLSTLNRAELMKILVEGVGHSPSADAYKNCFPDVKEEWFAKYVCFAKVKGWVGGYLDGNFRPAKSVSKAEAIKMILEAFAVDLEIPEANVYSDVKMGEWFGGYVYTAKNLGILEEDGSFYRPNADILRGQVSENIYRLLML